MSQIILEIFYYEIRDLNTQYTLRYPTPDERVSIVSYPRCKEQAFKYNILTTCALSYTVSWLIEIFLFIENFKLKWNLWINIFLIKLQLEWNPSYPALVYPVSALSARFLEVKNNLFLTAQRCQGTALADDKTYILWDKTPFTRLWQCSTLTVVSD